LDQEGVTKFDLRFTKTLPWPAQWLGDLDIWRTRLWELRLVGEDPLRYGGIGFGNVSRRAPIGLNSQTARTMDAPVAHLPAGKRGIFIVSGTQTGARPVLGVEGYALVTAFDIAANRLEAEGPIEPSSESLTHAMLYSLNPAITHVFHVHSPDIWRAASRLGLPVTPADVAYGTPAMADAVERLHRAGRMTASGVLVMGGHLDGVLAFGDSSEAAGRPLVSWLEQSRR